jgi:hypothetical protein
MVQKKKNFHFFLIEYDQSEVLDQNIFGYLGRFKQHGMMHEVIGGSKIQFLFVFVINSFHLPSKNIQKKKN